MQDEKLIRLLQTEPDKGMRKLAAKYGGLVFSVIRGKLSSPQFNAEDIEDCAAETFFEFWSCVQGIDPGAGVKGLLCVIAKRNALDMLRKRYRTGGEISLDSDDAPEIADEYSFETDMEKRELREALLRSVNGLGEPDREIIVRKFYLGQPSKQIAEQMGLSVSNVDTRTHRAVKKLRADLTGGSL
ncbi:MAG: sigma-70 family RNA polymerase sigma factor [Clostridia bacterium]|nr:sigma-70 family RNA polymerase sigma factor [Clostridia bacterium]